METSDQARPCATDRLISQLQSIASVIEAHAAKSEEETSVNPDVLQMLQQHGFFSLLAPCELGGYDLGPYETLQVFEALSRVDASTAWTVMVQNSHLRGIQFLEYNVVRDILYVEGVPRIAGQGAPMGKAKPVRNGYEISGRWSFGSAIANADFVNSGATIVTGEGPLHDERGNPETLLFVTPIENVVCTGNWNVLGLRATGSFDYEMSEVFVPQELTRRNVHSAAMSWGGASALVTFTGWLIVDHSSIDLGLGRTLLNELILLARHPRGTRGQVLAADETFRQQLARAVAQYESAATWIHHLWQGIETETNAGRAVARRQLTDARAAMLHLHETNAANAILAFNSVGTAALRDGRFQRLIRDILAAGQHAFMSTAMYADCARDYLGYAENMTWSPYSLA